MPQYGYGKYGYGLYGGALIVPTYVPAMEASPSFATVQEAVNSWNSRPRVLATIGGQTIEVQRYSGRHRIGETAIGRLELLLPKREFIQPLAEVQIVGGIDDFVGTLFSGYIPNWEMSIVSDGNVMEVDLTGWSSLMTEELREPYEVQGPVRLDAVFVMLCQEMGITSYIAMDTTYPNGEDPIMLGGNNNIDDGKVIFDALSPILSQFQRLAEPYGYYVTDTLLGPVVLHRYSGRPPEPSVVSFIEGTNIIRASLGHDVREIVNVWDINGQTYEDEFGGLIPIRSIADPEAVEPHPEIRDGYRYRELTINDIVRQDQADAIRNRYEIDYSEAVAPINWDGMATPYLNPGDVVSFESENLQIDNRYWLVEISIDHDDDGFIATYEASAGSGEELPGIVDRVVVPVQTDPVHLGDEFLSHYAHPATQGVKKDWSITIPVNASTVNVRGWHHGTNSQIVEGSEQPIEVTKWEIWLAGIDPDDEDESPDSSGDMPSMAEELRRRLNYSTFVITDGEVTNAGNWKPFAINMRNVDAQTVTLRLVAGEKNGIDDFEVRNVYLEIFGTVEAAGA